MEKRRSIQVDEGTWRVLKQRALDEGVTMRVLVAQLAGQRAVALTVAAATCRHRVVKELTYDRESE